MDSFDIQYLESPDHADQLNDPTFLKIQILKLFWIFLNFDLGFFQIASSSLFMDEFF